MNYKTLAGAIAVILSPAVSADAFVDARSAGMAGTGIASGDYTRANLNPALLTRFDDNDDFYLKLGISAVARDYNDTIDNVDDVQDQLDRFESLINNPDPNNPPTEADAQSLINSLKALDKDTIDGAANAELAFYRPSKDFAYGITIGGQLWAKGDFSFADSDEALIDNALTTGEFDQNDIQSEGLARAVAVNEIALSFATKFSVPVIGGLALGVTPKVQRLDSYLYVANISNYDSDDYFDDQYMTDTTGFNLDIGLHAQIGPANVGLVARNIISHELDNVAGETLKLEPTITAAAAVDLAGVSLELDLDLIEDKSFVIQGTEETFLKPRQWARLGAEVDIFEQVQLRAGYKADMSSNYSDFYTVGLGISPFDTVTIDLAGEFGDDDEIGGALQFGVKF